ADPYGQEQALTGLRAALLAAECASVLTWPVGFGVPADLFRVGRTPCWSWSARTAVRWTSRLSPGQRRGLEGRT
ncbi:hypothetical protein, partial [Deinococcus aquaticus]|uniref:hypothetical protein n=1 Tax=Deinococcus aquaticus TaxID=328692 RepID=UPI003F48B409